MTAESERSRWATGLTLLLFLLIGAGFCFHTSFDPVILGKYNVRYFITLCIWFLVLTPMAVVVSRMVFSRTRLIFDSGRVVVIRRRAKLVALLLLLGVGGAVAQSWAARRRAALDPNYFHPYLQTAFKPNFASAGINRWGFRGEEIEREKPPGTCRIFVFGGSTVASVESTFEKSHCRLLENRLRREYPETRVEVQNAGVPWHCTEHSLIKLACNVQDFAPDVIIIYQAINDLFRGFQQPEYTDGPYQPDYGNFLGPVAGMVKGRSFDLNGMPIRTFAGHWCSDFLYHRVRLLGPEGLGFGGLHTLFVPKARSAPVDRWRSLDAYERNLLAFVDLAKLRGIDVLVATEPYLYRDDLTEKEREVILFPMLCQENGVQPDVPSMKRGMDAFNGRAQRVASASGVRFFDLEKKIPKSLEYFFDDVHYTTKGNVAVAEAMGDEMIKWGIVPQTVESKQPRTAAR